ncbi:ADP-ribosylglycohydrolase family protein [Actinokineospora auranticolor]|uniref:ADP-ribosylglycohydrolase family protein n=1 Tax=Actinokineospora auranticolor TaxID=155976 RepID=UPI002481E271|nr:ADP-ribosylglycohydrolase family protein [Actinokineospora auranticolor]
MILLTGVLRKDPLGIAPSVLIAKLPTDGPHDAVLRQVKENRSRDLVKSVAERVESFADGHSPESVLGRALLITSIFDYDPAAALRAAVDHDGDRAAVAAIVGALVGARHGLPGLPPGSRSVLDLVESVATDLFVAFDMEQPEEPPVPVDHPGLPPVTDALRAEGRNNPDGWVWCHDSEADHRLLPEPPPAALLGAYKVGPDGELTGEVYLDPNYRPGPAKRGFPLPRNEFEDVLNLVTAEWLPPDRLPAALLAAQVLFVPGPDGVPRVSVDEQGTASWWCTRHRPTCRRVCARPRRPCPPCGDSWRTRWSSSIPVV